MKRILISGYLGFENFGDEVLLYILIKNLLESGYRREDITIISNNPNLTSAIYNIKSINRWNLLEIANATANTNGLVFIGGLFQDKTSFRSFLYYFFQLLLARILKKEIIFYGIGIGPLNKKISQTLLNFGIDKAQLITVRDKGSAYCSSYSEGLLITCDPAWTMDIDYGFQNQIQAINWQAPIIGVALRNDKNLKRDHLTNIADKLARALSNMKDWQALLIPCMPQEDLPVLYELQNILVGKTPAHTRITLIENFSRFPITQQAGILASCDVMVGMRYHAILVPLANGKPVLGLIYDNKVKLLLDYAGQVGVSYKDDLEQPWNYFWQNLEHSSNLAREAAEKAKQLHKKNVELLVKFLSY